MSLFDNREVYAPLASRLRLSTLEEFVGQRHLLGEGKSLRQLIEKDQISSMIFWGPPGVGKTTLQGQENLVKERLEKIREWKRM